MASNSSSMESNMKKKMEELKANFNKLIERIMKSACFCDSAFSQLWNSRSQKVMAMAVARKGFSDGSVNFILKRKNIPALYFIVSPIELSQYKDPNKFYTVTTTRDETGKPERIDQFDDLELVEIDGNFIPRHKASVAFGTSIGSQDISSLYNTSPSPLSSPAMSDTILESSPTTLARKDTEPLLQTSEELPQPPPIVLFRINPTPQNRNNLIMPSATNVANKKSPTKPDAVMDLSSDESQEKQKTPKSLKSPKPQKSQSNAKSGGNKVEKTTTGNRKRKPESQDPDEENVQKIENPDKKLESKGGSSKSDKDKDSKGSKSRNKRYRR